MRTAPAPACDASGGPSSHTRTTDHTHTHAPLAPWCMQGPRAEASGGGPPHAHARPRGSGPWCVLGPRAIAPGMAHAAAPVVAPAGVHAQPMASSPSTSPGPAIPQPFTAGPARGCFSQRAFPVPLATGPKRRPRPVGGLLPNSALVAGPGCSLPVRWAVFVIAASRAGLHGATACFFI